MRVASKLNLAVVVKRQFTAFAFAKRLKPKSSDAVAVLSYRFASRSDITLEEAVKLRKNFLSPAHLTYYKEPIMLCKGEAQYVWDSTGKRYLDLLAGVVTVGVGHCHPNAYHGTSSTVMGLTNLNTWKHKLPNTNSGMEKQCYEIILGGQNCRDSVVQTDRKCSCLPNCCNACDKYVEQLEDVLRFCVPKDGVAGFIAESIQGVGGTVQFPRRYLERVYKIIREKGGVCIADEVQTGFGRLGSDFWGFQTHNVLPDIVTMAKGIGNGFPMGAVITTAEIAKSLTNASFFNTFGGNPIASCVGKAVLQVIDEEKLQDNCHLVGTYFLKELEKLKQKCDIIGDVRGKGLMIGVELVANKETREPLVPDRMADLFEMIKRKGILVGKGGLYGNVLRIKPPMCITREDVNVAVSVLAEVLL